jgi:dTDP-glucose 4,6-dehydratase
MILILGGAGFIGSNFALDFIKQSSEKVLIVDKLTYAGNLNNLRPHLDSRCKFIKGDISDSNLIINLLNKYHPRIVINFAAESHVDRSIHGPTDFIETNIVGTFSLLESIRKYYDGLPSSSNCNFKIIHISTDEVYGSLNAGELPFKETNAYKPNSPYAASKASSDHLVRAWHQTYGLPMITTNCSNNYGPFQFPEKLIPLIILNAIKDKPLPIYGDGSQIRDWLFVSDHCSAIRAIMENGRIGEVYNIGGNNEITNLDVVKKICSILDTLIPSNNGHKYEEQIIFVKDRLGHDHHYAIDSSKVMSEFSWSPSETFESGIFKTVNWYLNNSNWLDSVISGSYHTWIEKNYKL